MDLVGRGGKDQSVGFVLDAGVTVAWAITDEQVPTAALAEDLLGDGFAMVPVAWRVEIVHALARAMRRDRITADDATEFLSRLRAFDIRTDAIPTWPERLFAESTRLGLSAYDTSYLLLAKDRGLPLATADARLREVAVADGVRVVG